MDIGQVQGMRKLSVSRVATMRHQVDLAEPSRRHVPTVGLHRDVMLQQRARLGASVDTPFPLALSRPQAPIDLPSTDAQKLLLHRRGHSVALANPGHPVRQQGLQSHRPGISRSFPNRRQHREHLRAIARSAFTPPSLRLLSGGSSVQKTNRVFPVVAGVQTKFVQHHLLRFPPRLVVTLIHCTEIFPLRLLSQSTLLKFSVESGYILRVSTASPLVTFNMARYALFIFQPTYPKMGPCRHLRWNLHPQI